MNTKVADLTVEELKQVIYEVIEDVLEPESELTPQARKILRERLSSKEWVEHKEVWGE